MDRLTSPMARKRSKRRSDRNRVGDSNNGKDYCGICGGVEVYFDRVLDINVCRICGAHETTVGWQAR
jgi:rubredoxin